MKHLNHTLPLIFYIYCIFYNTFGNSAHATKISQADNLIKQKKYDQAIQIYTLLESKYEYLQQWDSMLLITKKVITIQDRLGQHKIIHKKLSSKLSTLSNKLDETSRVFRAYHLLLASYYYGEGIYDSAIFYYTKLAEMKISYEGKDDLEQALIYSNLSKSYAANGDYIPSISNSRKAINTMNKLKDVKPLHYINIYNNIASCFSISHHIDSQLYYLKKSEALLPQISKVDDNYDRTLNDLANIYISLGQFSEGLKYIKLSLEILEKYRPPNDPDLAVGYGNYGATLNEFGDFEKGIYYIKKSINLLLENDAKSYYLTSAHSNLGYAYAKSGRNDKALKHYKIALDYYKKIYKNNHPNIGICYVNLAFSYQDINKFKLQLEYANKAINIFNSKYEKNNLHTNIALNCLASAYNNLGHIDSAQFYFNKVIAFYKDAKIISKLAYAYNHYAKVLIKKRQHLTAIDTLQKAIQAICKWKATTRFDNPEPGDSYNKSILVELLTQKAYAANKQYLQSLDIRYLKLSSCTYNLAIDAINKMRFEFSTPLTRTQLTEKSLPIFENAIKCAYELFKITGDDNFVLKAFELSEKRKAFNLFQSMIKNKHLFYEQIPEKIRYKERELKAQLATYRKKWFERSNENKAIIEQKILEKELQLDSLSKTIRKIDANYFNMYYEKQTIPIKQLRNNVLTNKSSYISYFIGPTYQFAFLITKNNLKIIPIQLNAISEHAIKKIYLKKSINKASTEKFQLMLSNWSKDLWYPIQRHLPTDIDQVIIEPDGFLFQLPFEMLHLPTDSTPNNLYLIQYFAISYTYSLPTLMLQMKQKSKYINSIQCLAFAPNYTDKLSNKGTFKQFKNEQLANLPGALLEIKNVSQYFDGSYYFGAQGDKDTFIREAPNYEILHLAMHGQYNPNNSLQSKLYFTNSHTKQVLHTYEIYALNLNAQLAVLSACETGRGKIIQSEGAISLGRAFMYAGCQSIVHSLWKVDDKATAQIMDYFYESMAKGFSKSEALRQAKIKYLDNASIFEKHPIYWSGFVLTGNFNPLQSNSFFQNYLLIGILLLAFAILIMFKSIHPN